MIVLHSDSLLKHFCLCIDDNIPIERHIITANEGNAVALAAGYHLATGKLPLVYMQNSGLGNSVNPLLSLCDPEVYSIPMLLLIGWRGEPGIYDEPQHVKQGKVQLDLLKTLDIPYVIISKEEENVEGKIAKSVENAIEQKIEGMKYIIIGHLLPELIKKESLWKIFVLRCEPNILISRYKLRNYEESKIKDNIVSELIGTICYESIMKYGENITFEIDVSNQSVDSIVNEIHNKISNEIKVTKNIDWLESAYKSENLREYLN